MQKLVFFVGVSGTGKTTIAARLATGVPTVFLDRDTVGGRFIEALLVAEGLDPDDRDSEFYKKHLRELEYKTTEDVCVDNLKLGQNVFMVSPFTQELKNREWIGNLLARAGKSREEVEVKVLIVILSNSAEQKERILARKATRDEWKLDHWDEYWSQIEFIPEMNWPLDKASISVYDNSGELTEDKLATLRAFVGL
jgi:predicted kinase